MEIYTQLQSKDVESAVKGIRGDVNVCVGKEWHRFPSSFYLPSPKWKLRFIRSEFKGQLPKPYGQFPNATTVVPGDMNDMNREEPSRYVSPGYNLWICELQWNPS
jgi:alpha-1,2-mannosyltransferase